MGGCWDEIAFVIGLLRQSAASQQDERTEDTRLSVAQRIVIKFLNGNIGVVFRLREGSRQMEKCVSKVRDYGKII